jgi:transposase
MQRRIVGVDLGVTSAHSVVVVDEAGEVLARRRCRPTRESLEALEAAALAGAAPGMGLEVVVEPTGVSWLPVASFFVGRGHVVYRVSSQKAADLRRFLSRHAKSNAIDAETLARVAIVDRANLVPLVLASSEMASLNRRARAADALTEQIAGHKTRIRELARHVMPLVDEVFTNKFGKADLAVLERYGNPRAILRLGEARLTRLIVGVSRGQHGPERAAAWVGVARASVDLYGDEPAVAFDDVAAEIASEARLIRFLEAEREIHVAAREDPYLKADPTELARTLPGVAAVGGPMLVAAMGDPGRFPNAAAFKSFTGLAPRANQTGDSDRKGQPMSKAGSSRLRDQLVCSANTARQLDPQLAAIYYTQMVERGAHHTKATCVVAGRLAERAWQVLNRGEAYELRDVDGRVVTPAEAKTIIAERYLVPDEVRRRRRTRTRAMGKAPQQVLEAHGRSRP